MMDQHVICRQVFEVEFFSQEKGFAFQQEFTDLVKNRIQSILDEILTELSVPKSVIRLDKVEIDLGEFSYPINELELETKLRTKVYEVINFKIVSISHSFKKEAELISYEKSEIELIEYFLTKGYLPWWSNVVINQKNKSIREIVLDHITKSPKKVEALLKKDAVILNRFISQYGIDPVVTLLTKSNPGLVTIIQETYQQILKQDSSFKSIPEIHKHFWFFAVEYILAKKNADKKDIIQSFFFYLQEKRVISKEYLTTYFPAVYIKEWVNKNIPEYRIIILEIINALEKHSHVRHDHLIKMIMRIISENRHKEISKQELLDKLLPEVSKEYNISIDVLSDELKKSIQDIQSIEKDAIAQKGKKVSESLLKEHAVIITNYLIYGYLSWSDRLLEASGIEVLIFEMHERKSDLLKNIFTKIDVQQLPYVIRRIENQFSKPLTDLIFSQYIDKKIVKELIESRYFEAEIIKSFFIHGVVPWMQRLNYSVKETENIIIRFYNRDSVYFIKIVTELNIASKPEIIQRMKEQFSDEFILFLKNEISSLNTIISLEKEIEKENIKVELKDIINNPDLIIYYLLYYFEHNTFPENIEFKIEDLVDQFIERHSRESKLFFSALSQNRIALLASDELKNKINTFIHQLTDDLRKDGKKEKMSDVKDKATDKITDVIYINNSGLILINPFLQRFFSLLNLLDKRKFKDEYSQHKAVYLLQYLVDKSEEAEEHQLVLNKIMCGLKLHEPIQKGIQLTEEDKETCESLLQGVIQNWAILKNTSNDGFRTSFLQREGRLLYEEAGWRLKVEERGFDVLIDRIPWAISMFKLPWMDKSVTVEWR